MRFNISWVSLFRGDFLVHISRRFRSIEGIFATSLVTVLTILTDLPKVCGSANGSRGTHLQL